MRRIWRLSPCTSTILKVVAPSCTILHFLVTTPSMGTPLAMPLITSGVRGLLTVTTYSFSWLLPARRILFTISPSLVKKISPCESLSSRPIGKMRLVWFTNCTILSRTSSSVVEVTPTGLLSAIKITFSALRGSSSLPFTRTRSPTRTWSPTTALRPLISTTPFSMKRSASRREHSPLSLINLFNRMLLGSMGWCFRERYFGYGRWLLYGLLLLLHKEKHFSRGMG